MSSNRAHVFTHLISPLDNYQVRQSCVPERFTVTHTSIFLSSVHLASSDGKGPILRIFGDGILRLLAKARTGLNVEEIRLIRLRDFVNACCIGNIFG